MFRCLKKSKGRGQFVESSVLKQVLMDFVARCRYISKCIQTMDWARLILLSQDSIFENKYAKISYLLFIKIKCKEENVLIVLHAMFDNIWHLIVDTKLRKLIAIHSSEETYRTAIYMTRLSIIRNLHHPMKNHRLQK